MSKTVKAMITRDYTARFSGVNEGLLISIRGLKGQAATKLRKNLAKSKVKVTVVRNALAKRAMKGTPLESLMGLLEGPSEFAFGGSSVVEVAREIVKMLADFPGLELKGAILDGTLFTGDKGVKELSTYPTKSEAQAQVVTLVVSPGRKLLGQIKGPGSSVAGIIKAIEMKLEKGEAIAKK